MGQHQERLARLQLNQTNVFVIGLRTKLTDERASMDGSVGTAAQGVHKAAGLNAFEGDYGQTVEDGLLALRGKLEKFGDYQKKLSIAINAANHAMSDTANSAAGVPSGELTPEQQNTLDMAAKTDSPVQVSPGVTLTPDQAKQHYLDQAEADREEAARKLNAALDARLEEIINGLPGSEYDPEKSAPDGSSADGSPSVNDPGADGGTGTGGGTGDSPTVNDPGVNGGPGGGTGDGSGNNPGVDGGPGDGSGGGGSGGGGSGGGSDGGGSGGGGNDWPDIEHPGTDDPKVVAPWPPGYIGDPPVTDPPGVDDPRIDGGTDGFIPGTGGGGGVGGVGVGGVGGGGGVSGGVAGGIAGGIAGGAARRVGGAGSIGSIGGASGTASDAGVSGSANAQSGAAGGRGMVAGGMGGAAGAGSSKKNRRRGQDLTAFAVGDEDEATPDLGEAGAAGRTESEGREEFGW